MGAAPLVFPTAGDVAEWWPRLAPLRPQALWLGTLTFHHLEALILTSHTVNLDRMADLALRTLARGARMTPEDRPRTPNLLSAVFRDLAAWGLAAANGQEGWFLTDLGRACLTRNDGKRPLVERRRLYFLDRGETRQQPHFVAHPFLHTTPIPAPPPWSFDPGTLHECVTQSKEWKDRHGFPQDIEAILTGSSHDPAAWRSVLVDQAEALEVLLVRVPRPSSQDDLWLFALKTHSGDIHDARPWVLPHEIWTELFPLLREMSDDTEWQSRFISWCGAHDVESSVAGSCQLKREGAHFCVVGPPEARNRLFAHGEGSASEGSWLVSGEGQFQEVVCLEWGASEE